MLDARHTLVAGLLLLPALVLVWFAVVHLRDGAATDAAVPVPAYMIAHVEMPKAAYEDAAAALAAANRRNGEAAIALAEARLYAGAPPAGSVAILKAALTHDPSSARGWTLLCETTMQDDRKLAARALGQALVLAPREYWLMQARVQDAALLWSDLDPEAQAMALQQTRMLWQEPLLRPQLLEVLRTQEGVALTARAFAHREDEIRAMNRWLSRERRRNTQ